MSATNVFNSQGQFPKIFSKNKKTGSNKHQHIICKGKSITFSDKGNYEPSSLQTKSGTKQYQYDQLAPSQLFVRNGASTVTRSSAFCARASPLPPYRTPSYFTSNKNQPYYQSSESLLLSKQSRKHRPCRPRQVFVANHYCI